MIGGTSKTSVNPGVAHPLEDATVFADEKVAAGVGAQLLVRLLRGREAHHDDAIGLGVGERPEQRSVHQAEDECVGADAEGQAGDCGRGDRSMTPERSKRIANVGDHILEPAKLPRGAGVFRNTCARTELDVRAGLRRRSRISLPLELLDAAVDVEA
jgi:hypothetical protein